MEQDQISKTSMVGDGLKLDYTDNNGIRRRVLVPADDPNPEYGVPVSLEVDRLYPEATPEFRRRLVELLWDNGLIEPCDFLKRGAADLIRASYQAVIRRETMDIITMAHEHCDRR